MAFRMATPYRHPKTGVYWFRKAVPHALRGLIGKSIAQRTLDTKDPDEARRRFVQVAADVQEEWAALSVMPDRLSKRARLALAGEFYRWSVARHTEEPGKPDFWEERIRADTRRLKPSGRRMPAPWVVVDDELAEFLAERKLRVPEADMWDLTREAADAVLLAKRTLLRQAAGDYRAEPDAERFPQYVAPPPVERPSGYRAPSRLTLDEHWDGFVKERALALGTQKRWRPLIGKFVAFLGRQDIGTATAEDVGRWKAKLIAQGDLSHKTIREGHLAALRTFCNWAIEDGRIMSNPCQNIRVARSKVVQVKPSRERDFNEQEARIILSESLRDVDPRTSPKFASARRWVPWLCAYTGARVNEMTQLRKEDLLRDKVGDKVVWQIRITPAAGTVKGGRLRDVPVHPHLVETGFLDFVSAAKDGPLFYDGERLRGGSKFNPPYRKVGDKLARWVREIGVDDPDIDPNHGWRHYFKTSARKVRMREEVRDGIAGHAPRTIGEDYGSMPIEAKWAEIILLPTIDVEPPVGPLPMTPARRDRNEKRAATAKRARTSA